MSQADIATLHGVYEAISRGDWDAAFRDTHPDFEYKVADRDPRAGTYRGRDDVRRALEDELKAFEEVAPEPEQFFLRGDQIDCTIFPTPKWHEFDGGRYLGTGSFDVTISDAPHVVEIDWKRSSSPAADDGWLKLWIDGAAAEGAPNVSLANLDNNLSSLDFVRLGALSVKTGASGTLFFDEFESRNQSYIGP